MNNNIGRRSDRYKTEEIDILDTREIENLDFDSLIEEDEEKEVKVKKEVGSMSSKKRKKKNNTSLIILMFLLFIIALILVVFCFLKPKITLKGDSVIRLTINSEYDELGATSKFMGKDASKDIKIESNLNTNKVGNYVITYTVKKGILKNSVKRKVSVVKDGPIITLEGEKEVKVCPYNDYEEIGFNATNSNNDNLNDKVKYSVKDDLVTYTLKDNNITYVTTRKLIKIDEEDPTIKLNGNSHIYVTVGTTFKDTLAIASDNCDGDLTDKIEVTGSVDTNTLGDYDLTYTIKDSSGHTATTTRKVTVQTEPVKKSASLTCGKAGVIYLTFDDGPSGATTPRILDILKKYNVKATFFVTSANGGSDALIKREADEGHLVALHTNSHEYGKIYVSEDAFYDDLNKISDRVEKITGIKSYIQRFPGGSSNTVSKHYSMGIMSRLTNDIEVKGYNYVDWNVDSRDAEGKNADEIVGYVTRGLSKNYGNVVLMHDIKYTTMNALERIIEYGLNNGYTFEVLDKNVICHHKVNN